MKFSAAEAPSSSADLKQQPEQGKVKGFDFYRDPLNAPRPQITFEEIMQADVAAKNDVMAAQRALLESRYILEPRTDPAVTMSRGKPVPIGPTAKLANDRTWDQLGTMAAAEMREANAFPYPPLPHPKHVTGGQVFPQMQIKMFPRLQRFDVDFDLPEAFLPSFRRQSFSATGRSSAMCRAAKWSRSTTTIACSKTCSPRCNSTACGSC